MDFNENVAAKINLYTYLEPVEGAGGCYRMFFDMPDFAERLRLVSPGRGSQNLL